MKVWLVVRVGVYDQGVCYVSLTHEDAKNWSKENKPDKDGYHGWEIREMTVHEAANL